MVLASPAMEASHLRFSRYSLHKMCLEVTKQTATPMASCLGTGFCPNNIKVIVKRTAQRQDTFGELQIYLLLKAPHSRYVLPSYP